MIKSFFVFLPLFLFGCATPKTSRDSSTYLMNTNKSQGVLMTELETVLKDNKYEIKTFDAQSGILVTKPRAFTYGSDKSRARHTVQLRQEGGSVSLGVVYDCEYADKSGAKSFETCEKNDDELEAKVKKIESSLVRLIRAKVDKGT